MSLLKFSNVSFQDKEKTVLQNISTDVENGDFVSIVGPSGSGKSTFLKLASHLISPSSGDIYFKNINFMNYSPLDLRKSIAYCFQTPYLFGTTVMDNLSFPYNIRNMKVDLKNIEKLFDLFNISKDFTYKEVKNLSGGEKQRIALIRTLLFKPEILLLDEVTSALDVDNTLIVENVISGLNKDGITVLWITHNPLQSKKYANKILTIENACLSKMEVL